MSNEHKNESPYKSVAKENVARKFKTIEPERILDIEKCGILPVGTDEIFVRIKNSNTHYISNYGRCISATDCIKLLLGTNNNDKIAYNIPLWLCSTERIWRRVNADILVVETFHEYERTDNKFIWHSGYNLEDNYYLNLYPMGRKEYQSIKRFYENGGYDSEKKIMELLSGEVYNIPTVLGVGYWGMPDVDVHHWTYVRWADMLMRCYSDKFHLRQPNYIECSVSEEWHNYSNFKRWIEENYYTVGTEKMELDKDILKKGNTIYSSANCIFVPKSINSLIINCRAVRGEYPIGVDYFNEKYRARMSYCGKQIEIGSYETVEEAFGQYKLYKEKFIRDIANKYKNKIPDKLYQAMMNWSVEITD